MIRRLPSSGVTRSLQAAWPTLVLFLLQRGFSLAVYVALTHGHWLQGLERWDAAWYRQVATQGYDSWPKFTPSGARATSNLAFFPLFPMAGRLLAAVTPLDAGSALVYLAWLGSLVAAWGIFAVGNHLVGRWAGMVLALAWGASPQAMVLVMGYPEGWLTAAIAFAILFLLTDRPVAAGVACLVAGLLHPGSLPLIAVVMLWALTQALRSVRAEGRTANGWRRYLLGAVLSPLGLLGVMVAIAVRTGHLFGYLDVQAERHSRIGSPLTPLVTMHKQVFLRVPGVPPMAVYAPIIIGYLILLALVVGQLGKGLPRHLPWVVAYTILAVLLVFANQEYFNSIPRHFLPVFTLLLPLVHLRSNRIGAAAALALASVAATWWGTYYILYSTVSI